MSNKFIVKLTHKYFTNENIIPREEYKGLFETEELALAYAKSQEYGGITGYCNAEVCPIQLLN